MADLRNPSPNGASKLKAILTSGRRTSISGRRASVAASEKDSILSDSSSSHHGFRHSVETVFEKLKGDSEHDVGDDHGIKKLVHAPRRIKSKHRQKKFDKEEEERAWQEAVRGRRIAAMGTLSQSEEAERHDDDDDDDDSRSFIAGDDEIGSIMTYDSEAESPFPENPPPLVSHPSHIGYLTTTSPLVQTTHIATLDDHSRNIQQDSKTLDILTSSDGGSSTTNFHSAQKRSPSPLHNLRATSAQRTTSSKETEVVDAKERNKSSATTLQPAIETAASEQRRSSISIRLGGLFPNKQSTIKPAPVSQEVSPRQSTTNLPQNSTDRRSQILSIDSRVNPVIITSPPTPVQGNSPQLSESRNRGASVPIEAATSNVITSPSGNMISHRRVRTNSATVKPSKLSNSISIPLTPTLEQPVVSPAQTGFFSSVLSAAQTAASSLTSTIGNSAAATKEKDLKIKGNTEEPVEDVEVESIGDGPETSVSNKEKEPAVKTLGQGDLNLSHLGIMESMNTNPGPPRAMTNLQERGRTELKEPLEGIPRSQTTGALLDSQDASHSEPVPLARPRSVYEPAGRERTPPPGSHAEVGHVGHAGSKVIRSSSARSAVDGPGRKRDNSVATNTTALTATAKASTSTTSLHGPGPKLTGFAVASKKRNRDFHVLFRSVPDDDFLIEDYSCALQREILAHGRLYVAEGHLCFSSNIFGWVTTLVMSFDEIVSVEKRSTALLFKNGLEIATLHAKHIFASFTNRDATYDLIVGIWKLGHPSLRSSINGVRIDETGGGDRTEKDDGSQSVAGSISEDESGDNDDGSDSDEDEDEDEDVADNLSFQNAESLVGSEHDEKVAGITSRKPSAVDNNKSGTKKAEVASQASGAAQDFPGPASHAPTECQDQDSHYEKVIADEIIPAPLGRIYNIIFGPASGTVMAKWLTGEQKCLDLQWEDRKGLDNDHKTRNYSYIKPLNGAIGPKQTKCLTTEVLDYFDLEKAVSLTLTTQTPDVPSGNVFFTKTKYCLSWAEGNATRIQANCIIEWTGKSWLKGPIEKGANEGMLQYTKDLCAMLRSSASPRGRAATMSSSKGKTGKKGKKSSGKGPKSQTAASSAAKTPADSWGLFESIRPLLEPITSIFSPFISGNMFYFIVVVLLATAWFGGVFRGSSSGKDMGYSTRPQRIAAYEEMWRREESELWEWLSLI